MKYGVALLTLSITIPLNASLACCFTKEKPAPQTRISPLQKTQTALTTAALTQQLPLEGPEIQKALNTAATPHQLPLEDPARKNRLLCATEAIHNHPLYSDHASKVIGRTKVILSTCYESWNPDSCDPHEIANAALSWLDRKFLSRDDNPDAPYNRAFLAAALIYTGRKIPHSIIPSHHFLTKLLLDNSEAWDKDPSIDYDVIKKNAQPWLYEHLFAESKPTTHQASVTIV